MSRIPSISVAAEGGTSSWAGVFIEFSSTDTPRKPCEATSLWITRHLGCEILKPQIPQTAAGRAGLPCKNADPALRWRKERPRPFRVYSGGRIARSPSQPKSSWEPKTAFLDVGCSGEVAIQLAEAACISKARPAEHPPLITSLYAGG